MTPPSQQRLVREANRLAKWRKIFAGWCLGTRLDDDSQAAGFRDLAEKMLLLRAEVNALVRIIVETETVSQGRLNETMADEYAYLADKLSDVFPGMKATDLGISMDLPEALETMKRLGFPQ